MSGVLTDGGPTAPSVPLNPDGTPKLETGAPVTPGALTLWDIPQELTDYLAGMSGGKLWFDIGKKKVTTELPAGGVVTGVTVPGLIGAPGTEPLGPNRTETHKESYDILRKPEAVMKQFAAMSVNDPAQFMALQKALASGPWGTVYLNGVFDQSTEAALGQAMLQYVKLSMGTGAAMPFTNYLFDMGQRAQQLGGDGTSLGHGSGSNTPAPIQVTDPAAIRQAAQSAAQAALGQGLSESQLDAFVAQFQGAQTTYQTTDHGTITAPDLSSQASAYAQQSDPQAYKQNQKQAYMNLLVNMFAPSGSERPSMTPVPSA